MKAGLVLGLLGGSRPGDESEEGKSVPGKECSIRSDIHVLIVGDPGLGKSQMLRAAAGISPRAVTRFLETAHPIPSDYLSIRFLYVVIQLLQLVLL